MELTAVIFMLFTAILVGASVSLDVSGFNLSKAGDSEYSSKPVLQSFYHAMWHGVFLAIGVGAVQAVSIVLKNILVEYDLAWMFTWLTDRLNWLELALVPTWILGVLAIGLWFLLYWNKIRGEAGDEVPTWLKRTLLRLSVPLQQLFYVAVAVDMWFLTPLLQSVIKSYPVVGKVAFVLVVFATVFCASMLSIRYGQKFLAAGNRQMLFYWAVTFVVLEPIITGYFAARIGYWSITGEYSDSVGLIFGVTVLTGLLCIGKFKGIVAEKWEESGDAIAETDGADDQPQRS
jgi:hypothetical protein